MQLLHLDGRASSARRNADCAYRRAIISSAYTPTSCLVSSESERSIALVVANA